MSRDITPISFKTVPGRNKTQKWTKAPAVDYGGDEWGGYDDYGEYEDDTQPPLPPTLPASQAPRDPYASSSGLARKNSFDQGDETRAFSSNTHPTVNSHQEDPQRQHTPGRSPARDFTNPEQVPAPLSVHNSPVPTQGERWPGRKESMSSRGTPPMPSASSGTSEKPLPFIRPSDIYKRIPDEIRRQSEDGTRPSMDSIGSGARERTGLGLEPVAESRESRVFLDNIDTHSTALRGKSTSPRLPDVTRFSGFGDEFLTGSAAGNQTSPTSPHSPEAVISRVANAPVMDSTGSNATSPNSIQHTPTTRAPPGQDPAAEILAERQHGTSVENIAGGQPAGLQHQPSAGFRSAVHTAFDRDDNAISRDNSQGSVDVHRSDTTSTAGISPIISRGPQFPSIAEETYSTAGRPDSRVPRKPSPGGTGGARFEPGYRRSLDPPSSGTSPARTPGLESVETRRLSTPMSAVPMDAETPDVIDQGAEMPIANLEPVATPSSEVGQLPHIDTSSSATAPIPITGRGRSGTDYSMREADIAQTINSASPEQDHEVPGLINAQRDSQKIFLQTHPDKQPPTPTSPGGGLRGSANGSRAGSPTKGRVREIADKFHGLNEAARRNSAISISSSSKALSTKSSWSNFDDAEKKLGRQGTGQSESEMFPAYDNADLSPVRPGVGREESFKPDLPGGWISSAPTPTPDDGPGAGRASPLTPQQTKAAQADEDELTPTTRKIRLQEALTHKPSPKQGANSNSPSALEQVKNAGSELGAALMATVGVSHQTRDFASAEPAAPVDEREVERPARGMQPPTLFRQDTDSDAPSSVASTMPPSPPAKDTPKLGETLGNGYFNTVAPLRVKSREGSPAASGLAAPRPGMTSALSMEPGVGDEESDRLRKEIVRSLDPIPPVEDAQLIQDALDAPDNQRRVANGQNALPPAESRQPALLQTRFSWEKPTPLSEQAEPSPEIKPEMSYERPRSRALHVVNPNEVNSPIIETPVTRAPPPETLKPDTFGTPVSEKQETALLQDTDVQPASPSQSLKEIPASPISERKSDRDVNRQSYYASDDSQAAGAGMTTVLPGQGGLSTSPISSAKAAGPGKPIPPFRNILALKTGDERIKSYNETRTTFANMNTGLGDWVGGMLALHPELASNATTSSGAWKAPPLQTTGSGIAGTFLKGHKASPSLAKFTNKFGGSESQLRSTSVGSVGEDGTYPSASPSTGGGVNVIRPTTSNTAGPSSSTTGLPAFDTDKMQQKGKAFMAKTGVLGGKAQAGAKGLFAKGKSRFASGGNVRSASGGGSEKVVTAPSSSTSRFGGGEKRAISSPIALGSGDGTLRNISSPIDPRVKDMSFSQPTAGTEAEHVSTPPSVIPPPASAAGEQRETSDLAMTASPDVPDNVAGSDAANHASLPLSTDAVEASAVEPTVGGANEKALKIHEVEPAPTTAPRNASSSSTNAVAEGTRGLEGAEKQNMPVSHDLVRDASHPEKSDDVADQENSLAQINTSPEFAATSTMAAASLERPSTAHPTVEPTGSPETHLPETPISAIRPGFSRRTSSKSASPFRNSSPFRRDASQTPGSESKSRRLSMVWGDWLREKTRSSSRSQSRQGASSRPASVVLDKTESAATTPRAKDPPEFVLGDLSDVAVHSSPRIGPIAMPARTETWNSPDAVLPPRTPETRELVLERLGVLPSPAPTSATFESPGSRKRRRSSAARMSSVGGEGLGLDLETVQSGESDGSPIRSAAAAGRVSPVRSAMVGLRKVSEAEEVVVQRPQQQRRISDLEMLPSEQKRLSLGLGQPRPDSMILLQSQVDLLAGLEQEGGHEGSGKDRDVGDDEAHLDRTQERNIGGNTVVGASDLGTSRLLIDRSRPVTGNSSEQVDADTWDGARSEVSAEDGAADEVPRASLNAGTSRHSSVSSLGAPDSFSASQGAGNGSTLSVQSPSRRSTPANGPPLAAAAGGNQSTTEQRPARPGLTERALSYMPLPRDESGIPVPETITTGSSQQVENAPPLQQVDTAAASLQPTTTTASLQQINTFSSSDQSSVAVDLTAMSGPPPGAPSFQPYPVRNNVPQVEPPRDFSAAAQDTPNTQGTATVPDAAKMKRRSGFFSKPRSGEPTTFTGAPPPNRITDNHGIENLHDSDDEAVPNIQPRLKDQQPAEKQNRRRSGLWDVLTTKRPSSGTKLDNVGDDAAASSGNAAKAREEKIKGKLQKPQRASSSAIDLEPKKKRFSALGSLFGRSDTTRRPESPKSNKLTKMAPPISEHVRRTESPRQDRPGNANTVTGNVGSYDEYEARRKREATAYQQTSANARSAALNGAQGRPVQAADMAPARPPLEGWYGSSEGQQPVQHPSLPAVDTQPEYRRLHSQGKTTARPASHVPQAFRPVEASFNAPVTAVGPPPDPRIMQDPRPTASRAPSTHARRFSFDRQNSYGSSAYASEFSGFSGQQVAGQMLQQQQPPTPSLSSYGPDVSPIMTRSGPPAPVQGHRVISRGTEAARSPANDYSDQQTPWAITIPPGGEGSTRTSRASSWGVAPEGLQYPGPPAGAPYRQQQQYPPSHSGYNGPYFPPSGQDQGYPPQSYSYESSGVHAPQYPPHEQFTQQQYTHGARMQQQQYSYPQHQQQQNYQPQQPRPQNRYYSQQQHISTQQQQQAPPQQMYQPQHHDPRFQHHYRRRSSGYSGRRDDITAGEEDLIMRGVSYPGQEWQPPGLGRSGWD